MRESPMAVLASLTTGLLRAPDLPAELRALTDAALAVTPADHASLRLCDPNRRLTAQARSGIGRETPSLPVATGEGLMGWVAEHARPVRVGDGRRDPRFKASASSGFPVTSVLSVPIIAEGRTLGVLSMSAARADAFADDHETVATLLANTAAQSLRTAELARLAITDAHTGTYNRRHLLPRLSTEMDRARRRGEPLTLMLMDLDHFKRVNDAHGHAAGDGVLNAFVARVRASVRSIDILIRRGGEEFVLVLPDTDAVAAHLIAERVRRQLVATPVALENGEQLRQTVSIGVAEWDGRESPEQLDRRADQAMYRAKAQGRNRVLVAPTTRHCARPPR